ncbi:PHA/PHB synthase family protein [Vreelandella boliviensis]|uniref:Poly-beta-hydroxybutyrate polymerase n=1 Tax=Vreelandella boliviensis LC1 TaxID=1072583 RepID=A0A265DZK1_9GAMM|nr:alpha/beta fold hydrolase [Halomonas boliviensis]EHJ91551.1 Poly-beta-hydroxybutyrate polymerase [Halomonas boliviensis LC1]OZT74774.1 poly-beta-hydroxybutyrate polymerase [Halomonas boliviensis LC1]
MLKRPATTCTDEVAADTNRSGAKASPPSLYKTIDQFTHSAVAKTTGGLAPSVLGEAWLDWAVHMAASPGKQWQLMESAMRNAQALWLQSIPGNEATCANNKPEDKRFASHGWQQYPFNLWSQAHCQHWQWWQEAMTGVHGVAPSHEDLMAFVAGLLVDTSAPSNFPFTNPDVIAAMQAEQGQNFVRGAKNLANDLHQKASPSEPASPQLFKVGQNLAITPGKVVFRNHLIELIQYTPSTERVRPEPILIVPAWIMKYYILDLSPTNSLVQFLVGQGFTVFIVSWKNPSVEDRDLGMEEYRQLGVMEAIDAIQAITQAPKLHAVGYCLGGTLLAIAAAAMARDGDDRCATVSLLAAQIDFTEAGPLRLFINDSQVTMIEDMMSQTGYLSSDQMAGAFALLRAKDLIWAPAIDRYLLGVQGHSFDLMTWNADATRMPYRMHSEYLRRLFLNNDLADGRYQVGNKAIAVTDIRAPIFAVGTEDDHVAPWRSVYKLHLFVDVDVTFVLTSGGHNAGIVSEPGHQHRHFRIANTPADAYYRSPADWCAETTSQEGSWWPGFTNWLAQHSSDPTTPPHMGTRSGQYAVLCDAPGTYVKQT